MAFKRGDFYINLATLLESGVSMPKAMETAVGKGNDGPQAYAIRNMASAIARQSVSLFSAMNVHKKYFPELDLQMVRVGEESGRLAENLQYLGEWYIFAGKMARMVVSGLAYPVAILHAAAFILPVSEFFKPDGGGLAGYLLIAFSFLAVFYVPAGILFFIVKCTPREGFLRKLIDRLVMAVPVIGKVVMDLCLSRYSRAFYALYEAGVPIVMCARMSAAMSGSTAFAELVRDGEDSARAGRPVSEGFEHKLPEDFISIWQVGEQSGKLYQSLQRLVSVYGEKAEDSIRTMVKWLPKIFYFMIVGIIAWQMVATLVGALGQRQDILDELNQYK